MLSSMAAKPGFFDYVAAAFNARPFGMFVAPNWIGLGAFGLLGMLNPGFWVIGAGLELGYLLTLSTNPRFQRCWPPPRSGTSAFRRWSPASTPTIGGSTTCSRSGAARSSTSS
jgi:hypothetical protein